MVSRTRTQSKPNYANLSNESMGQLMEEYYSRPHANSLHDHLKSNGARVVGVIDTAKPKDLADLAIHLAASGNLVLNTAVVPVDVALAPRYFAYYPGSHIVYAQANMGYPSTGIHFVNVRDRKSNGAARNIRL